MTFCKKCKHCNAFNQVLLPNAIDNSSRKKHENKTDITSHSNSKKIQGDASVLHKTADISEFRNILTEAISNVTRENLLRKGESVELTLEIELVKSGTNTPANSLVEVKIIQHNKELCDNEPNSMQISEQKMAFKDKINNYHRESMFHWHNEKDNHQHLEEKLMYPKCNKNEIGSNEKNSNFFSDESETMKVSFSNTKDKLKTVNNRKQPLLKSVPENQVINDDFKSNDKRAFPDERNMKSFLKGSSQTDPPKNPKRHFSLVHKLSNAILSSKNEGKNTAALIATKNNKNCIKHDPEKNIGIHVHKNKEEKKPTIEHFRKLASNTQADLVDSFGNDKDPFMHCKGGGEPILRKKRKSKKTLTRIKTNKNITTSFSDIYMHIPNNVEVISNYTVLNQENAFKSNFTADSINYSELTKAERKYLKESQPMNGRGDARFHCKSTDRKIVTRNDESELVQTKTSTIYWNGERFEIDKEVKKRIEIIILNELQNLALKEGMECDVTPLPSTEDSLNNIQQIEKVSSFICELDISDEKIKRTIKNIKSIDSKHKLKKLCKRQKKNKSTYKNNKSINNPDQTLKTTTKRDKTAVACFYETNDSKPQSFQEESFQTSHSEIDNQERTLNNNDQDTGICTKVLYFNSNFKNSNSEFHDEHNGNLESKLSESPINSSDSIEKTTWSKESIFAKGFVRRIASNDSTWYNFLSHNASSEKKSNACKIEKRSNEISKIQNSAVSYNECENIVEIELPIKSLEPFLKEAKVHKVDKLFIQTKCNNCKNKTSTKSKMFTGKNHPLYTTNLLTKAAKKLEKYCKNKNKAK